MFRTLPELCCATGRASESVRILRALPERQPDDVPALRTLIYLRAKLGDGERAHAGIQRAARLEGGEAVVIRLDAAQVSGQAGPARVTPCESTDHVRFVDLGFGREAV